MVIYLDVFFAVNFAMDLLVLLTVKKITHENKSVYRIVLSAMVGAIYACIVLMRNIEYGILEAFTTYVVISILLTIIAFGYKGIVQTLEMTVILFSVTFIISGIVNTLYARRVIDDVNGLLITALIGIGGIITGFGFLKKRTDFNAKLVNVRIIKDGRTVETIALLDTGNSLREPISRKPVAVLTKELAVQLRKGDDKGIFVIPFKSVGKEHGILMGFMADFMEIRNKNEIKGESIIKVSRPIIAEYDGLFDEKNAYQMLLHPQMMKEGEEDVGKSVNSGQNAV